MSDNATNAPIAPEDSTAVPTVTETTSAPKASQESIDDLLGVTVDDEQSAWDVFGTDTNMEQTGMEIDYGPIGIFLIARAGGANKRYTSAVEQVSRPYRRQIDTGQIEADVLIRLTREVFVKACLLGWESEKFGKGNIPGPDGKAFPYNVKNAELIMKQLPDLFDALREECAKGANYRALELEIDAKN